MTPSAPKATICGGDGRGGPLWQADLGGGAGSGLRGHGLRDEVEDAGVGEVGEEDGVEGSAEGIVLGARRCRA